MLTPAQLSRLAALCEGEGGVLGNVVVTATLDAHGLLGPVQGVREKLAGAIKAEHVPRISAFAVSEAQKDLLDEPGMADHRLDTASPRLLGCSTFSALIDALAGLRHSRPNIRPIDFHWELRDTYRPAEFEGRNWLFRRIEQAIQGRDRGFIVLAAGPGFGKTAFALHLVERWREAGPGDLVLGAWHFLRKTDAAVSPAARMVGQLEWRLRDRLGCPLGANASKEPITNSNAAEVLRDGVLREVADKATEAGQKLLLVIDGLDEGFGQNSTQGLEQLVLLRQIFPGPQALPEGVFVLFTSRPGGHLSAWLNQDALLIDVDRDEAAKRDNEADLDGYLQARLTAVDDRSSYDPQRTSELAQRMAQACEGAFFAAEWFARTAGEDAAQFERWLAGEKLPRGIDGVLREDWKHKLGSLKHDVQRRLLPVLAAAIAIWHEAGTKVTAQAIEELFTMARKSDLDVGDIQADEIRGPAVRGVLAKLGDWFDAGAGQSNPIYTFRHSRIPELILDRDVELPDVLVDEPTQVEVHRLLAWTSSRWGKLSRGSASRKAALANAPWHFAQAGILGSVLEEEPMEGGAMRLLAHWLGPESYLEAVYEDLDNAVSILSRNYAAAIALAAREEQQRTLDSDKKPDPSQDRLLYLRDVWRVLSEHGELLREPSCPLAPSLHNHLAAAWDEQSQAHKDLVRAAEDYTGFWLQRMNPEPPDRRLIAVLRGHTGPVTCLAVSPDGTRIASGSLDKTLRLWDARTGEPVGASLAGHTGEISALAWSPDGKLLASGSHDTTLRLWDAATGAPLGKPLTGHSGRISCLTWSPDSTRLASGSDEYDSHTPRDCTVRRWDARAGVPVGEPLRGHMGAITCLAWANHDTLLASGSDDGRLCLWDARAGELVGKPLIGNALGVTCIAWSPDDTLLASGGRDSNTGTRVWDVTTGEKVGKENNTGSTSCLSWSPDGTRLASGSISGGLFLLDADTGEPPEEHFYGFAWQAGEITCLAWSPDSAQLAIGSADKTLRVWDTRTGTQVGEPLAGHADRITGLNWLPGAQLASCSWDDSLRLWDTRADAPRGDAFGGHRRLIKCLAWSPDGARLASGSDDGGLCLWDSRTGVPMGEPLHGHPNDITCLAWSPDGAWLASGSSSNDATVALWDGFTGVPYEDEPLRGHLQLGFSALAQGITCLAWSPVGMQLASGGSDGALHLWDGRAAALTDIQVNNPHDWITCLSWSPDGKALAIGSAGGNLRLWDACTDDPVSKSLRGHAEGIRCLTWSPDGTMLASGSWDATILLWDPRTGEQKDMLLTRNTKALACLIWSPDGALLATTWNDKTLRLCDARTGIEVAAVLGSAVGEQIWASSNNYLIAGMHANNAHISQYYLREPCRTPARR